MRKITKLRRSIKAVSPVISVLLMIAIAVIASLVAYAWVMGYMGGRTEQTGKQIGIQSYKTGTNLIYVQNTGQGTVHLNPTSSVYINDVLKNIDLVDDKTLINVVDSKGYIPIDAGQTRKLQINYIIQAGDRIKIVTVEGTWMEIPGANQQSSQQNPTQYTITPSAGTSGSISPSTPQTVNAGSSVTFNIAANQGYHIRDVVVDSVSQGARTSYTFTNVQASHTIQATFEADEAQTQYTITPSTGPGGSITPSTPQTVNAGGSVTFNIVANEDYHIKDVLVDGLSVGTVSSYPFTNVQANHVISATFEANPVTPTQYTITVIQNANGNINPGTSTYVAGSTPSFAITPNGEYHIASITANGVPVIAFNPTGHNYQFSPLTSDGSLTATFAANLPVQYTITVTQTAHGTIVPGTTIVNAGANQAFAITPDTDYHIASITANGASVDVTNPAGQTYTFTGVSSPCTLTATYEANPPEQFTVTFEQSGLDSSAGTATVVTVNGTAKTLADLPYGITVNVGDSVIYSYESTISGGTGKQFVSTGVTGPASPVTSTATVTGNYQTQYYLTVTSDHSTVGGQGWYNSGATAHATLTSGTESGGTGVQYAFTNWGADASGTNYAQSEDITMDGPKTATADWKTQYYVTFSANPSQGGTTTASGWYDIGALSIFASANSGYSFSSWTFGGNVEIANPTSASTTATINGVGTITANFISTSGNKLVFIDGTSQSLVVLEPSGRIRIQRQNSAGNPITISSSTYVTLTTTSSGGKFYTDAACTDEITSTLRIYGGQSYRDFYYRDSSTGTPTITATATSYQPASTTFTISAATPTVGLSTGFDGTPWDSEWRSWPNPPWDANTEQYYSSPNSASSVSSNQGAFSSNKVDATGAAYITVSFYFRITGTDPTDFQIRYGATRTDDYNSITWVNLGVNLGDRNVYAANTWHYYSIDITSTSAFTDYFRFQFVSQSLSSSAQVWVDNVQIVINK